MENISFKLIDEKHLFQIGYIDNIFGKNVAMCLFKHILKELFTNDA